MALYLSRDDGTGTFFPDEGFVDLVQVANMDTGIGQVDDPVDTTGIQVSYARTDAGIPPQRLDDLCNELTYSGVDIVIFPVDASFVTADGTAITSIAGMAAPVGNVNNPTAADIVTFYDTSECNGSGWWVDKEGGGTTAFPRPVILYHELSHCIHFATGTADPDGALEEVAAENDENDMRDQLGIDHREATSHNGGCGGGPFACCVVASVASGSPFSQLVNELRRFRDHFLRRTRVGEDFFTRLHRDYYAVSPEIVRLMGRSRAVHEVVRDRFVTPLVLGLDLIRVYAECRGRPEPLGRLLAAQVAGLEWPTAVVPDQLPADLRRALDRTAASPYVSWGLVEVLLTWTSAAEAVRRGVPVEEVGRTLSRDLADWSARLPVSPVWAQLRPAEAADELTRLGSLLLWDPTSRTEFAGRLLGEHPELTEQVAGWAGAPR